ncbi:unnamed protein product [Nippostrongylus brasiliensis]|uniref:PPM-type phosphatase domain-containing protein n=1 Tax=Nippostrongylus brasiliensis TaxID=27835 RepID=A0A0N4YI70_NIPBR|nr:unnamed protein product [Nippostrongylus brasiliensis]
MIVVASDLSGHVGTSKDGYKCHGGFGYGARNEDGESILEYACSHDLSIMNTTFRKRPSLLISFYSANARSQIDYVVVRRRDAKLVNDAKAKVRGGIRLALIVDVDNTWQNLKTVVYEAARSQLGVTRSTYD